MKKEKTVIGRIVRYRPAPYDGPTQELGAAVLPAVIVFVHTDDIVNLQVLCNSRAGMAWKSGVYRGDSPGQWQWPKQSKPELMELSAPDS